MKIEKHLTLTEESKVLISKRASFLVPLYEYLSLTQNFDRLKRRDFFLKFTNSGYWKLDSSEKRDQFLFNMLSEYVTYDLAIYILFSLNTYVKRYFDTNLHRKNTFLSIQTIERSFSFILINALVLKRLEIIPDEIVNKFPCFEFYDLLTKKEII